MSLAKHIVEVHDADLKPAMECFEALRSCVFEDKEGLALSVYNEGIAMAVRRGAPLALYSINRKWLHEYICSISLAPIRTPWCVLNAHVDFFT